MPAKRKNGRPPNDPRGVTAPKLIYLIPAVAKKMEAKAKSKGFPTASQMVGAWIDQGCKGVKR